MTLKYESEILFDLMKRDGDDTPSDVLPYESELKEKYLHQVEGAYPKLQDYRPEWLNYNLNAHLPADFPVETLSNVTSATVDNVVPYAYGSAILKGLTLVNLTRRYYPDDNNIFHTGFTFTSGKSSSNRTMRMESVSTLNPMSFKPNTKYLIQIEISELNLDGETSIDLSVNESSSNAMFTGTTKFNITSNGVYRIITTTRDTADNACVVFKGTSEQWEQHTTTNRTMTISHVMYLEYQDGMENWDIPYFEGMQSVKMPVLSTTGKNLAYLEQGYINTENGNDASHKNSIRTNYISIDPQLRYSIYGLNEDASSFLAFYDCNKNFISRTPGAKRKDMAITPTETPTNARYIRLTNYGSDENSITLDTPIMIEQGYPTSYEPYKSNILRVDEDVTLRGIGDVQDTLDCLKGELTQRIDEVVWDGSDDEVWVYNGDYDLFVYQSLTRQNDIYLSTNIVEKIRWNGIDRLALKPTKYGFTSHKEGIEYLKNNPITIQYKLATESIKTVDLTVTDQDGNTESIIRPIEGTMHLMTEGDTIKPLFSGEIPVEATTQNLMSFANILEGE